MYIVHTIIMSHLQVGSEWYYVHSGDSMRHEGIATYTQVMFRVWGY